MQKTLPHFPSGQNSTSSHQISSFHFKKKKSTKPYVQRERTLPWSERQTENLSTLSSAQSLVKLKKKKQKTKTKK